MTESAAIPPGWDAIRQVLDAHLQGLKDRLLSSEHRIDEIERGMDTHVADLWENIRKGQDKMRDVLSDHARTDEASMQEIREKLLSRVPAWALMVMTVGASMIGGMATYIIDHLK